MVAAFASPGVEADGGATLYAISPTCLAVSRDYGDSWGPCWNATGLTGRFSDLVIKDNQTMLALRSKSDVPLRTTDGGHSWENIASPTSAEVLNHC